MTQPLGGNTDVREVALAHPNSPLDAIHRALDHTDAEHAGWADPDTSLLTSTKPQPPARSATTPS